MPTSARLPVWLIPLAGILAATGSLGAQEDAFRQRVAPVLERRCLSCHNGIDRKGDLSLETAEDLLSSGYVEPGHPAESHLLAVVVAEAGTRPSMPKDGEPLSPEEVAALKSWVAAGAVWPAGVKLEEPVVDDFDWWSLRPLARPEVPRFELSSPEAAWIQTPVDAFILAKLRDNGLTHAAEADRRTLIRRITFDLIGLPPTPEEIEAFVSDPDPQAYERLVDRLLHSPHYGERWARHWLDVVRYADTCGYDKDKLRPNAWPYRDYVVRSLNDDKPYGRFVQEQIAGDVLFPGTADGVLGLGFLAAGPWDFIGHVEVPASKLDGQEARNLDRDEMVSSTLNTFCSATVQCARCHNHKFDPFTQEHYYSLQAVFAAVDRADRAYDQDPDVERRREDLQVQLREVQRLQAELDAERRAAGGPELVQLEQRIQELKPVAGLKAKQPEFGYHSAILPQPDREQWVQVDLGSVVDFRAVVLRPCHDDYAGIGAGFGFPVRFRVAAALEETSFEAGAAEPPVVLLDQTSHDFPNPGLAAVEIHSTVPAAPARFIRVTATRLAARSNDYILALAELQVLDAQGKNRALGASVTASDSIEAPVRWGRRNLTDGIWAEAARPDAADQLAAAERQRTEILSRINTPERNARQAELARRLKEVQAARDSLPSGRMVYAAATDFVPQGAFVPTKGVPRTIRLLHRGNITQPRDQVSPGTLPVVSGVDWRFTLPPGHAEGERRAALARWITRGDHPLTWRSIVNRIWHYHFGRGIVDSPNDFGRMGQLPTHPELLDWLAVEFRDTGESFRRLHRLIVTSSVYRQASTFDAGNASLDASNQFLWRMNRRRLEAEEIRDAVLAVSGSLSTQMGGPGYYLFVLEKTEHSPHYEYHLFDPADARSHRRSLYRFIVRSQPDPYMTTLDCADSSQSTPRRDETLTALQALSLLNNRFNLVMAEHFAARLEREAESPAARAVLGMRLVTGRPPTPEERVQLEAYAERHGLANLCRVLMNLSEFVYVD